MPGGSLDLAFSAGARRVLDALEVVVALAGLEMDLYDLNFA